MSAPISASTVSATRSVTPGIVVTSARAAAKGRSCSVISALRLATIGLRWLRALGVACG
jgi:hypothetical protein